MPAYLDNMFIVQFYMQEIVCMEMAVFMYDEIFLKKRLKAFISHSVVALFVA